MNLIKIIGELRAQQQRIEQAILMLERLATGRRRGRPPLYLSGAMETHGELKPRKRRMLSPEARARMADAQKRRWAAYHAKAQGSAQVH